VEARHGEGQTGLRQRHQGHCQVRLAGICCHLQVVECVGRMAGGCGRIVTLNHGNPRRSLARHRPFVTSRWMPVHMCLTRSNFWLVLAELGEPKEPQAFLASAFNWRPANQPWRPRNPHRAPILDDAEGSCWPTRGTFPSWIRRESVWLLSFQEKMVD
jgi:hypothetical protein